MNIIKTPNLRARQITRVLNYVVWSIAIAFLAGYGPAKFLKTPIISIALAALGAMWVGSRLARPIRGAAAAGVLGAIAGLGMAEALASLYQPSPRPDLLAHAMSLEFVTVMSDWTGVLLVPVTCGLRVAAVADVPTSQANSIMVQLVGATTLFCALAGGVMGYMARRRQRMVEQEWGRSSQ